jgi:hypothetical protein
MKLFVFWWVRYLEQMLLQKVVPEELLSLEEHKHQSLSQVVVVEEVNQKLTHRVIQ